MALKVWLPLNGNLENKGASDINLTSQLGPNLVTGLVAGGQTTISNGTVTTSGTDADTYFRLQLSSALVTGQQYTISCIAENVPAGKYWSFPIGTQSNTSLTFKIYNGYNEYTFIANDACTTNPLMLDDNGRAEVYANRCIFKNWILRTSPYATDPNGKIGKCIKTSTLTYINLGYNGDQINNNSLSFGGWFKFNQAEISNLISGGNYTSSNTTATGNLIGNDSYGGIGLIWQSNNIYSGGSFSSIKVFGALRTPTQNKNTTAVTIAFDTWTHLFVTFNQATGVFSLYQDGVLVNSQTFTTITDAVSRNMFLNYKAVYGGNALPYNIPFYVNDIRIYDHCLSKREVKEISQGLILHYKLDDSNIESSQNLVTTADCFENATCFNGATSKYGYGTTTDIYKTSGLFEGRWSTKIYMGTAGQNAYPYVYFTPFNAAGTTIQSLSFDYFPTSQTGLIPYSYNGAYNWTYVVNGVRGTANNAATCPTLSVNLNQWNHIEITAIKTDTTNTTRGIGYIRIGTTAHTSTTTDYWLFANVQVENKDHATQYMGIGGSRIGYAIDSSGYGNNGLIRNSPIVIQEASPRYEASTRFNGTSDCIYLPEFYLGNEWSYGCWINTPTSTERGWEIVIILNNTGSDADSQLAFWVHQQENRFESLANTKYTSTISYTAYYGNWHHFFATYNGNVLTTYIDGTVVNTKTITDARYNATHLAIGARCANATATSFVNWFEGQLSDVRIYATALPIEEVQKLYNTPTEIDKHGAWHTHQFTENDKNDISKTGLIEDSATSEWGLTKYLKYDPNIYFEPDGSAWIHIYHHNNPAGGSFVSSNSWTKGVYLDENRWFTATQICNNLNKWEFLIKYCYTTDGTVYKERWVQNVNPETAVFGDVDASDITRITGDDYKTGAWGGLYRNNSSAYWVMNNGNSGNWWGATGAFSVYQGGIPGYGGSITTTGYNDLYVRIDNNITINDVSEAMITKNKIYMGNNLIEK